MGVKNSESCLIKAQCGCDSNNASWFQRFCTSFRFLTLKSQYQYNQIYELIQFFSVWFWFAKVSRVKLLVSQT